MANQIKIVKALHTLNRLWKQRRFNYGMTKDEIMELLRAVKINYRKFWKKFGVYTAAVDKSGETLHYFVDIETAILCCLENRDKYDWEWD